MNVERLLSHVTKHHTINTSTVVEHHTINAFNANEKFCDLKHFMNSFEALKVKFFFY